MSKGANNAKKTARSAEDAMRHVASLRKQLLSATTRRESSIPYSPTKENDAPPSSGKCNGAVLKDLRIEDKEKVASMVREIVKLGKEKDDLSRRIDEERRRAAESTRQAETLRSENQNILVQTSDLQKRFQDSVTLLDKYKAEVDRLRSLPNTPRTFGSESPPTIANETSKERSLDRLDHIPLPVQVDRLSPATVTPVSLESPPTLETRPSPASFDALLQRPSPVLGSVTTKPTPEQGTSGQERCSERSDEDDLASLYAGESGSPLRGGGSAPGCVPSHVSVVDDKMYRSPPATGASYLSAFSFDVVDGLLSTTVSSALGLPALSPPVLPQSLDLPTEDYISEDARHVDGRAPSHAMLQQLPRSGVPSPSDSPGRFSSMSQTTLVPLSSPASMQMDRPPMTQVATQPGLILPEPSLEHTTDTGAGAGA
eukprot:Rmarinus@m.23660